MRYLVRKKKARVAHLWNNLRNDTVCRTYSTGGIRRKNAYKVREHAGGLNICENCLRNAGLEKQGKGHHAKRKGWKTKGELIKNEKQNSQRRNKKRYSHSHTYKPDDYNESDRDTDAFMRNHGGW